MNLKIVEIRAASDKNALNTEWIIVENVGETSFSTKNCTLAVSRPNSKKKKELGTIDPGFTIAPGEKVRIITGNPGRKAHGKAPVDDAVKNYNLFLGSSILMGTGSILHFSLRSHPVAKAIYDPEQKTGVAAEE
jgi:hypothetical protein